MACACGPRAPDASRTAKVIGDNDLTPVAADASNLPANLAPLVDAVAWTNIGCTATHVGGGVMVSAGHCLTGSVPFARQEHQPCSDITVRFGYRAGATPHEVVCVDILAAEFGEERDYVYFQIAETPAVAIPLSSAPTVAPGTALAILQHAHGQALAWSGLCDARDDAAAEGASHTRVSYTCDTQTGSSGSAVLDAATGEVVGIHSGAGLPDQPWNYATLVSKAPLSSP